MRDVRQQKKVRCSVVGENGKCRAAAEAAAEAKRRGKKSLPFENSGEKIGVDVRSYSGTELQQPICVTPIIKPRGMESRRFMQVYIPYFPDVDS